MAGRIVIYNPDTGFFINQNGKRLGGLTTKGYRKIRFKGRKCFEHRLAFFLMNGVWPKDQVDHINGVPNDNRWCNLREATNGQNQRNIVPYSSSGVKGVYKKNSGWVIRDHNDKYICVTDDFELAVLISNEIRERNLGEWHNGRTHRRTKNQKW